MKDTDYSGASPSEAVSNAEDVGQDEIRETGDVLSNSSVPAVREVFNLFDGKIITMLDSLQVMELDPATAEEQRDDIDLLFTLLIRFFYRAADRRGMALLLQNMLGDEDYRILVSKVNKKGDTDDIPS